MNPIEKFGGIEVNVRFSSEKSDIMAFSDCVLFTLKGNYCPVE